VVRARFEVLKKSPPSLGRYVTFITYPNFKQKHEDAYELFSVCENGIATTEFYPSELFTMAAIGDAGDTALTLDLEALYRSRKSGKPFHEITAPKPWSNAPQSRRGSTLT
jgi:hypothetical protein